MDAQLFRDLFERHPTPTLVMELDGRIVCANAAAQRFFSVRADATFFDLCDGPGPDAMLLRRAAESGSWQQAAVALAGEERPTRVRLMLRGLFRAGEPLRVMAVVNEADTLRFDEHRRLIRSLNAELAAQYRLRAELDRALESERHLHRELIHRVKNNLSLLAVLVRSRKGKTTGTEARAALSDVEHRIQSMALVHEMLDRKQEIDVVQADVLLEELCRSMEASILPPHIRIERRLTPVRLHISDATPLSLLVNELVTNALKHAFGGRDSGRVELVLERTGDEIELQVADDGAGMGEVARNGSGSFIVEALTLQLRGRMEVEDRTGVRWRLRFSPQETEGARRIADAPVA